MKMRARPYNLRGRLLLLAGSLGLCGFVLVGRAAQMQLLDQDFYAKQGDQRFLREVPIATSRGMIMDRNGEPLAVSTPVESVWANPKELLKHADRLPELADALGIPRDVLTQSIAQRAGKEFVFLRRRINPDDAEAVVARGIPRRVQAARVPALLPARRGDGARARLHQYRRPRPGRPRAGLRPVADRQAGRAEVIRDRRGHIVENVDLIRRASRARTSRCRSTAASSTWPTAS
jgi:cell division protein FtsI (penicillin-binding protein 3)